MAMDPRKDSAREVANKERACVWQLAAALLLGFVRIGIRAVDKPCARVLGARRVRAAALFCP